MSKGQITIFMIIGIVILFSAAFILFNSKEEREENAASVDDIQDYSEEEINRYIEACVSKTIREGLALIGEKGGYLDVPGILEANGTAYWYYKGTNVQPSLDLIEKALEEYADANMKACVLSAGFEKRGLDLEFEEDPKTDVTLKEKEISGDAKMRLSVGTGEGTRRITRSRSRIQSRFLEMYGTAAEAVNEETETGAIISDDFRPQGLSQGIIIKKDIINSTDSTISIIDNDYHQKIKFANRLS